MRGQLSFLRLSKEVSLLLRFLHDLLVCPTQNRSTSLRLQILQLTFCRDSVGLYTNVFQKGYPCFDPLQSCKHGTCNISATFRTWTGLMGPLKAACQGLIGPKPNDMSIVKDVGQRQRPREFQIQAFCGTKCPSTRGRVEKSLEYALAFAGISGGVLKDEPLERIRGRSADALHSSGAKISMVQHRGPKVITVLVVGY